MTPRASKKSKPILMGDVLESQDLLQLIFKHLPMKDLARCKGVCKYWKTLVSHPRFSVQLSAVPTPNRTMLITYWTYRRPFVVPRHNGISTLGGFKQIVSPDAFYAGECMVVGTWDGLICLSATQTGYASVWNPVLKQKRVFCFPKLKDGGFSVFGFGFDKVREDYKVVKVTQCATQTIVQIWNLYSTTVKTRRSEGHPQTIKLPSARVPFLLTTVRPVTVNGSCHWVAVNLHSKKLELVRFDMESETFVEMPFSSEMPNIAYNVKGKDADPWKYSPANAFRIDGKEFRLGIYYMQVCLLITTSPGVEIWCMGNNLNWSRKFNVKPRKDRYRNKEDVLGFSANNELVMHNSIVGAIFARDPDTLRILYPIDRTEQYTQVVAYVESLVPLGMTDEIGGSNEM